MKVFKNIFNSEDIFQSSKPASFFAFIIVAIILTSLLSARYYLFENIISNGIAQKSIKAKSNFTVVDKQRTEIIKREVANKIRDIVVPIEGDYIKTDLQKAIDEIEKIKNDKKSYQTKQKELFDLLEINDTERKTKAIAYILNSTNAALTTAFTNTKYILNEVLSVGVFDSDVSNFVNNDFINKSLGTHVKSNQYPLIISLIEHSVVPNLIVDEYATEIAKKNARNAVKPYLVSFKEGEMIIQAGERVTQVKRDALKQNGDNAFKINKIGISGIFAIVCLTMYSLILYIKKYEKKYFNPYHMGFIATLSMILILTCIFISKFDISNFLMPFIAYTLILAVFTNPVLSFLITILLLGMLSVALFLDAQLFFVFICATLSGGYLVSKISYAKRMDIIWCSIKVGMIMFFAMLFCSLFEFQTEAFSRLMQNNIQNPFWGLLNGLISSMIALFFIPIIEKICKIVSPYALIELADQNQELLSKMRSSAPGTFHHSLIVSNLCEAASAAIGADSILARVGALYHDIGKLQRPLFFIENQSYFGVENPHATLTPRQSKMVITLHTKDGVEMGRKYGLPEVVIDFIQQHHGETLAGYFYNKAIEQEGAENVQEGQFRYPGPKPKTKETAILMLADALESAVRSLKKPTQEEIEAIVNRIFTERLNDGQLSDSPLTLKDIKIIAMTFNKILRGMQHDRIKYQERVIDEIKDNSKITIQNPQDIEFEKKIQELQAKSYDRNENEK